MIRATLSFLAAAAIVTVAFESLGAAVSPAAPPPLKTIAVVTVHADAHRAATVATEPHGL